MASQPRFHALEDFRYDSSQDGWWSLDTRRFYREPRSVNAMVPKQWWPKISARDAKTGNLKETIIKPADYIADVGTGLVVDGSIWWPGQPQTVENFIVSEDGDLIRRENSRLINTYREPPVLPSFKMKSRDNIWVAHVKALWPIEEEHNFLFDYCAHMLQRPEEKANGVITLSGEQGIGKDMTLNPIKAAIGEWNTKNIKPGALLSPYNSWAQAVMLVIDEMRPSKEDFHASSIYEELKTLSVTPPDMIPLTEKYMKLRYVRNVMRIFITTNNMTSMYIHPNDRRFTILHSSQTSEWKPSSYFKRLATWLEEEGGNAAVAQWLRARDISKFNPKDRAVKTAGFKSVISTWSEPEDMVAQALDKLGNPKVLFPVELLDAVFGDKEEMEKMLRVPRRIGNRMQQSKYYPVPFDPPKEFKGVKAIRVKTAYAKIELMNSKAELDKLIDERGDKLANPNKPKPKATNGKVVGIETARKAAE